MAKGGSYKATPEHDIHFATRLKQLRAVAGLTQEELASKARLSARAIRSLERGERKHPYPHTVRSLADALGLPENERLSLLAAVPGRGGATRTPATAPPPRCNLPTPPPPFWAENENCKR